MTSREGGERKKREDNRRAGKKRSACRVYRILAVVSRHDEDKLKGLVFQLSCSERMMDCILHSARFFFFFAHTSTFQLLDKPWTQVSSLLPPGSCLQFLSRTGFSNPTARRFFIECC